MQKCINKNSGLKYNTEELAQIMHWTTGLRYRAHLHWCMTVYIVWTTMSFENFIDFCNFLPLLHIVQLMRLLQLAFGISKFRLSFNGWQLVVKLKSCVATNVFILILKSDRKCDCTLRHDAAKMKNKNEKIRLRTKRLNTKSLLSQLMATMFYFESLSLKIIITIIGAFHLLPRSFIVVLHLALTAVIDSA